MKKILFTACVMLLSQLAASQTVRTLKFDTLSPNRLALSVFISGDLENIDSVKIALSTEAGSDTLLAGEFSYSIPDADPSEFYSFSYTEEAGYVFGLGLFDSADYHCVLYMKREGEWEAINLN